MNNAPNYLGSWVRYPKEISTYYHLPMIYLLNILFTEKSSSTTSSKILSKNNIPESPVSDVSSQDDDSSKVCVVIKKRKYPTIEIF